MAEAEVEVLAVEETAVALLPPFPTNPWPYASVVPPCRAHMRPCMTCWMYVGSSQAAISAEPVSGLTRI